MESHQNRTELDYTVLDNSGTVLFQTKTGLSGSIHEAVIRRDTILDVEAGGEVVGKLIIENDGVRIALRQRQRTAAVFLFAALFQCALCVIYAVSVRRTVILPFRKLQRFAERVAGGNLDIPLTMDRQNLFGAFTESFDIMRSELKKSPHRGSAGERFQKRIDRQDLARHPDAGLQHPGGFGSGSGDGGQ